MNRESMIDFPVLEDDDLSSDNSEDELQYDSDIEDGYSRYMGSIPVIADIEELSNELIINEDRGMEDDGHSSQEPVNVEWKNFEGRQKKFKFTGASGIIKELSKDMKPMEAFFLFVDDEVINLLVNETNKYAEQKMKDSNVTHYSRMHKWTPTNSEEMRKFLGLIIWMGLVNVGPVSNYWSKKSIYNLQLPRSIMSHKRFQLLLNNLHFADNSTIEEGNRVGKIKPLIDTLLNKYQDVLLPEEDFVVNETLIPYRGRITFNQYISKKVSKYGIKMFKLCTTQGYTWSIKLDVELPEIKDRKTDITQLICLELAKKLVNEGRTMYISNFYANYELALSFLKLHTHVVGILAGDKLSMQKDILYQRLKKGELISQEDGNGIVVMKWKDIGVAKILSTKHAPILVDCLEEHDVNSLDHSLTSTSQSQRIKKLKPLAVIAYERAKSGIGLSGQIIPFVKALQKGMKWYRKLGLQLILGISLINALIVYRLVTHHKIHIRIFKEQLIAELLGSNILTKATDLSQQKRQPIIHNITIRKDENGKKIRRTCVFCYSQKKQCLGRVEARRNTKKPTTYCPICPKQPHLCIECFAKYHER